jgi:hypothetical protein
MSESIDAYNDGLKGSVREIASTLCAAISRGLPLANGKVWHGHPVWFLDGNPVTGYVPRKEGVALLFWSGQSFDEPALMATGKFKMGEIRYLNQAEINESDVDRWLRKAGEIQWDYKNIVKRKGELIRLT